MVLLSLCLCKRGYPITKPLGLNLNFTNPLSVMKWIVVPLRLNDIFENYPRSLYTELLPQSYISYTVSQTNQSMQSRIKKVITAFGCRYRLQNTRLRTLHKTIRRPGVYSGRKRPRNKIGYSCNLV